MTEEAFYAAVGKVLGTSHTYVQPASGATKKRWGPRTPGNGRYPGFGIVRMFSPNNIHVALNDPPLSGWFNGPEHALRGIRNAIIAACSHDWTKFRIVGHTGDWFHPHIMARKCLRCGVKDTEEV